MTHTHKKKKRHVLISFSFRKTASKNLGVLVDDGGTACSLSSLVSILELWSLTNLGSVQNQSVKLRRVYVFVGREWMESLPNEISRLHKCTWSIWDKFRESFLFPKYHQTSNIFETIQSHPIIQSSNHINHAYPVTLPEWSIYSDKSSNRSFQVPVRSFKNGNLVKRFQRCVVVGQN